MQLACPFLFKVSDFTKGITKMMAYCFFPHAEEKEMFVAEVGTVTQMCSFITSRVLLVVYKHGSFL